MQLASSPPTQWLAQRLLIQAVLPNIPRSDMLVVCIVTCKSAYQEQDAGEKKKVFRQLIHPSDAATRGWKDMRRVLLSSSSIPRCNAALGGWQRRQFGLFLGNMPSLV